MVGLTTDIPFVLWLRGCRPSCGAGLCEWCLGYGAPSFYVDVPDYAGCVSPSTFRVIVATLTMVNMTWVANLVIFSGVSLPLGSCVELRRSVCIHRSRKNRLHTLSCFRTCRRTRVCFEKPWKIFAALPSPEKYTSIVLAMEAREGPNTSRQSRASHGDDWPPLRGDDGQLSFTW